jgi:2-polyprenyl-3-methyl-5-hydroxy-6-metoxy-1,4-benzoquinol methylase
MMLSMTDERQAEFAEFEVPDPGRIRKVHAWLRDHGFLDTSKGSLAVMEIGYAKGGLLDYLADGGDYTKVAVDIHEHEVGPGVTFVQHDCNQDFDFADESSFDVVFAGEIIEHIYDDRRFLEQIHRVLRPGGVVALTTPNLFFWSTGSSCPSGRCRTSRTSPTTTTCTAGRRSRRSPASAVSTSAA